VVDVRLSGYAAGVEDYESGVPFSHPKFFLKSHRNANLEGIAINWDNRLDFLTGNNLPVTLG
jgi:hypothetical protein